MALPQMVFLILAVLGVSLTGAAPARPNIILVMADDQGYGDAGYTGHPFVKTPHLDAMAKQSVIFDRFYAGAPVCSPTRASVMTGRAPMRTHVLNHGHYMRPDEVTIAEVLKSAGYVTGHFGKWHIGSVQKESPTCPGKVGFDEWLTGLNFFDLDPYLSKGGKFVQKKGQGTVITMDATLEFLKKHKEGERPMFAVTWFPAPHLPHKEQPVGFTGGKELYKQAGKLRGYFLEISLVDQQLGRLRRELRKMGIAEDTVVWYCSDNGGLVKASSGGREKKGSIYEGGLRVPSLLEWPAKLSSKRVATPASTMDIYPTLLGFAGVTVEQQPKLDGIDLGKILEGSDLSHPPMGFWHGYVGGQSTWSDKIIKRLMEAQQAGEPTPYPERLLKTVEEFPKIDRGRYHGHAAWTAWPWKLHRIEKKDKIIVELYHLAEDPMEAHDLAESKEKVATDMLKELENWQSLVLDSLEGRDYKIAGKSGIKVLIVDGFSNHDWRQTTRLVKKILEESGRCSVDVSTTPSSAEGPGWEAWRPRFSDYDVVVQNTNDIGKKISWPRAVQEDLEEFVAGGGGLYILHSANNAFPQWKEYNKMIGLGWRDKNFGKALTVDADGKVVEVPRGQGKGTSHGKRVDALVSRLGTHAIHQGMPDKWTAADIEIYRYARGPAENLTVLSHARDAQTGVSFPIEWVIAYGKGKVYNSTFGHVWKDADNPPAARCVAFQTLMIRAIEWVGSGEVTWPLPDDFPGESGIRLRRE